MAWKIRIIKRRTEKEVVTMLPHGVVKSEMGADQKELAHYEGLQDFLYEAEVPGRHLSGRICLHNLIKN